MDKEKKGRERESKRGGQERTVDKMREEKTRQKTRERREFWVKEQSDVVWRKVDGAIQINSIK